MADNLLEIYFFGLICFHGGDAERNAPKDVKRVAMLLDEPNHKPRIFLNSAKGEELTTDASFTGVSDGPAGVFPSFGFYVPHLVGLSRQTVKLNLQAAGKRVTLPRGSLATVQNYEMTGEYELDGRRMFRGTDCIARVNFLEAATSHRSVNVYFNGRTEPVPSSGFVLLVNAERDKASVVSGERRPFREHHSKAIVGPPEHLAELFEKDTPCKEPVDKIAPPHHLQQVLKILEDIRVADHPECSNSQWP